MTEAPHDPQPAGLDPDEIPLEAFIQGLRNLEAMAGRLGIKAISTGHGYWRGTEAARNKYHDFPTGPYTKLTLEFNTGDELILDWGSSSGKRLG